MSKFHVDEFVLLRLPAYSYENYDAAFLTVALETDFFRSAIFFASRSFYEEWQKNSFDYGKLDVKGQTTLWKYFNRMCYRSLPYALFASFSAAKWGDSGESIPIAGRGVVYTWPDYKMLYDYLQPFSAASLQDLKYFPNNTLYQSSQQLRLITETQQQVCKYGIQEIRTTPLLRRILKYAARGRTMGELLAFVLRSYDNQDLIISYLQSLVAAQVLTTELAANITGTRYSERMKNLLADHPGIDQRYLMNSQLPISPLMQPLPELKEFIEQVASLGKDNTAYILYEKELSGPITVQVKAKLLNVLKDLDKLTAGRDKDIMANFRQESVHRYAQREVPLMEVLDAGTGIGYENLAGAAKDAEEDYIKDLGPVANQKQQTYWGPVQQLILKKWLSHQMEGGNQISIGAADLDTLADSKDQLPPGLFVLFKVIDNTVWVDQVGGYQV